MRGWPIAVALLAAPPGAEERGGSGAAPEAVQPVNLQTTLATDLGTLSEKFTGLARVMAGKYDWRPGHGVRSVGEVFNLIVGENRMLAGVLTGPPSQGGGASGGHISDPAELQEALASSYAALKQKVSGLASGDRHASVRMFGRDMTKENAVLLLLFDQREHLGQSIAYARTNGVVPPWSK